MVLVGTQHPGNIGSAARALKTMGLSRLALVDAVFWNATLRPRNASRLVMSLSVRTNTTVR